MRRSITKRILEQLRPKSRPYEVRDTRLTGFILRVQPSGHMSYICQFGRGRRLTIGSTSVYTPAQARDEAKHILADATKGIDPAAARNRRKGLTLKSFIETKYRPWVQQDHRNGDQTADSILSRFSNFQNTRLTDITPLQVDKWRRKRAKAGAKPATINRYIAALKAALSKAAYWELIDSNPIGAVKLSKLDRSPNVRFLDSTEEERLRNALDARELEIRTNRHSGNVWRLDRGYPVLPNLSEHEFADHLKPMVLIAMNTGLRRGELFNLCWKHVDLKREILTVSGQTAKSGNTRQIPLCKEAIVVLTSWKTQQQPNTDLVFPSATGAPMRDIKTAWGGLLRWANIQQFRFHDLRHHFASRLVMDGADLNAVRELLGHSDMKMTLLYAHLAPEHKAQAVRVLDTPRSRQA